MVYFPWASLMAGTCEVCAVQYPGRGTRIFEPLLYEMEAMVEQAAEGLKPYFDRPFAFFGHSLGALIAFELARYLNSSDGIKPIHIFVSGHHAPHLPNPHPFLYQMPDADFLRELRRMNGTSPEVWENEELVEILLPILRADFTVCETYQYVQGTALSCPITALGGMQDEDVPRHTLEAWSMHTTAQFAIRVFQGDHFYLNSQRVLLLQAIIRDLDRTLQTKIL